MAKERNNRYATPSLAKTDVERVLNGEAPISNPPNISPVPRPPRGHSPAVPAAAPHGADKTTINEAKAVDRTSTRNNHRSRRMGWSVILLVAGIVWLIGIILMIWLIRDVRDQQPQPPTSQSPEL